MYQRIVELCKKRGVSPAKMCEEIGIAKQNMTNLKKGAVTTLRPKSLQLIADYFDVSVDYLLGTERSLPANVRPITQKKIPVLGSVACGEPRFTDQMYDVFIPVDSRCDCDFAVQCVGDSMIGAGILDGDYVLIKQSQTVPNGMIAAVQIGDEATLKKYEYYPEKNLLILSPFNSNHRTQIYQGSELESIYCLGLAVGIWREFKNAHL